MTYYFQASDVSVYYHKAMALAGVTLALERGEAVAVVGPNGAGKTTLLRAISALVPHEGEILFEGKCLKNLPVHAVVRKGIVHCPEGRRLFPELTVLDNLLLGAYPHRGEDPRKDLERVFGIFPVLEERQSQQASTFSGGQQQMLAIGRALMARPRLLLLDEPSLGLSPIMKERVAESILAIGGMGVTILLVEQDVHMAFSVAQRAYLLEHGQVVMEGKAEVLREDEYIKSAYLGSV